VRSLDFVTAGFQFWAVGSVRHLAKADPFPASVLLEFAVATPGLRLLAPDRFFAQGLGTSRDFPLSHFPIHVADPPPAGLCFCRLIYLACGADLV
jgi:hypothetical protein